METLYACAQSLTHRHNNKVWVTIQKHKQYMIPLWGLILSTSSHYLAFLTHTHGLSQPSTLTICPCATSILQEWVWAAQSWVQSWAVLREDFLLLKVHSETCVTAPVMTWISRLWTGPVLTIPLSLNVQHKEICQTAIILLKFHLLNKKHKTSWPHLAYLHSHLLHTSCC